MRRQSRNICLQATVLTANGLPLNEDSAHLGELVQSNALLGDPAALQQAMARDGYLFFRGLIDADTVLKAREEVLEKFAIVGEIDDRHPLSEAIAGDRHSVASANLRALSRSVRGGYWYTAVTLAPEVLAVHEALLGGDVRCFDFRWPRLVRPGEGCGFHCDGPYMARGTDTARIFTSWIPLGDVNRIEGSLLLLEDSHRNDALHRGYLQRDADRDGLAWLTDDPVKLQESFGSRWLTADFAAGDVLCFGMHTIHGSLDNQSPRGRCRLSSDTRYQRSDEPADHRWNDVAGDDVTNDESNKNPAGKEVLAHGGQRVFYPGLGKWRNVDFNDEWKRVDEHGRLIMPDDS